MDFVYLWDFTDRLLTQIVLYMSCSCYTGEALITSKLPFRKIKHEWLKYSWFTRIQASRLFLFLFYFYLFCFVHALLSLKR